MRSTVNVLSITLRPAPRNGMCTDHSWKTSLANAQLYMCIAALVTSFDLELLEADVWDTEIPINAQHHSPRLGSKGVRVFAKRLTYQ